MSRTTVDHRACTLAEGAGSPMRTIRSFLCRPVRAVLIAMLLALPSSWSERESWAAEATEPDQTKSEDRSGEGHASALGRALTASEAGRVLHVKQEVASYAQSKGETFPEFARRLGTTPFEVEAFSLAIVNLGGSVADALASLEALSESRKDPEKRMLLRCWGVQLADDPSVPALSASECASLEQRLASRNQARSEPTLAPNRVAPPQQSTTVSRQVSICEALGGPYCLAPIPRATAESSRAELSRSDKTGLMQSLKEQLHKCWKAPEAARRVSRPPVVAMRVPLNRDGSLAKEPTVLTPLSDRLGQAVAASALRAIKRCVPFQVPDAFRSAYNDWKDLVVNFDPREAMPASAETADAKSDLQPATFPIFDVENNCKAQVEANHKNRGTSDSLTSGVRTRLENVCIETEQAYYWRAKRFWANVTDTQRKHCVKRINERLGSGLDEDRAVRFLQYGFFSVCLQLAYETSDRVIPLKFLH